jgi:hypothetical protein
VILSDVTAHPFDDQKGSIRFRLSRLARPQRRLLEKEIDMKRIAWIGVLVIIGFVLSFGMSAAGKSYQFTGTVKSNDGGVLTVEKSAKETWTFSTNKDTKGTAKVGDKVTVYYTMIATEIEAKPATPTTAKKRSK